MPLAVGSKAPDFTIQTKTADGPKDVKLSDNFGKKQTVLLFFPAHERETASVYSKGLCLFSITDSEGTRGRFS